MQKVMKVTIKTVSYYTKATLKGIFFVLAVALCSCSSGGGGAAESTETVALQEGVDRILCSQNVECARLGLCSQDGDTCIASRAEHCLLSHGCRLYGECAVENGHCVAASDAQCESSKVCHDLGRCSAKEGVCGFEASAPDACVAERGAMQVSPCVVFGRCDVKDGQCVAGPEGACQSSQICKKQGACGVKDDACTATTPKHCLGSEGCQVAGLCTLQKNECVLLSDEDCGRTRLCEQIGVCTHREGACVFGATYIAECESPRGAQQVTACGSFGLCALSVGQCVADGDMGCAASKDCAISGNCSQVGRRCAPSTAEHCRDATACEREGRCVLSDGTCVVSRP